MNVTTLIATALVWTCCIATAQESSARLRIGVNSIELFENAVADTENMQVTVLESLDVLTGRSRHQHCQCGAAHCAAAKSA